MRSGISRWVVPPSWSTPSMRIVGVPSPSIFAPRAMRKLPRPTISGSMAAWWIVVAPRASTAALRTLAVPVTVEPCGPERSTLVPAKRRGFGHDAAVFQADVGAEGGKSLQVQIDRPVADIAPARQRHDGLATPRHERPKHAEARPHPPHESFRGVDRAAIDGRQHEVGDGPDFRVNENGAVPFCAVHPECLEHPHLRSHVGYSRHAQQSHRLGGQDGRRHNRQRGILRSAHADLAL